MASKLTLWRKVGRFVTGLVIVCFFLPFFGVSCRGFDVVTMSGTDMIAGCKPGGALSEGAGLAKAGGDKVPNVDVEPLAIIAFACAVIGFGLAWVKTRGALVGALVVSIAGLGALGGLFFKVKSNLDEAVKSQMDKDKAEAGDKPGDRLGQQMMQEMDLDVGARMGLYLTALLFVSVAALAGMALADKSGGAGAGSGPPPQGYQPPQGYPPQGYPPPG